MAATASPAALTTKATLSYPPNSASIQTISISRVFELVYGCQAGLLTVNRPSAGVEYQLPFGGTKDSSFGPKEQGPAAMDFYSDYKTVYLK